MGWRPYCALTQKTVKAVVLAILNDGNVEITFSIDVWRTSNRPLFKYYFIITSTLITT